jgi:hypothetical protein
MMVSEARYDFIASLNVAPEATDTLAIIVCVRHPHPVIWIGRLAFTAER